MADQLNLTLNGAKQAVASTSDVPLLYVLRNDFQLKGPRFGCGLGQCGACAVLVEGKEVRSCITPVGAVANELVTTIEGLPGLWAAAAGQPLSETLLHPVQQAWIDEQVPQCGYCQSGMMIAAVELLANHANPTVEEIKDAFTHKPPSPHLCRCGTYGAIIDAVQRAARAMTPLAR